jgi:hypothetical protein
VLPVSDSRKIYFMLLCRIAVASAILGGLLGCVREAPHVIGAPRLADSAFPDLSNYAPVDAGAYSTLDGRNYFGGPTFSTPDGHRCSSNVRDPDKRLFCSGTRPDASGYWQIAFSSTEAATVTPAPDFDPTYVPTTKFKVVPPMHKIEVSGFVCGTDGNGMMACRNGEHGFVLTSASTTLF